MSDNNSSVCLVVGAGGFIGFNLCIELHSKYKKIYACDTNFSESIEKKLKEKDIVIIEGGVELFALDLRKYRDVEDIYYFAGKSTPSILEAELNKGYFSDQEILVMMLEASVKLDSLKTFIYGSSGGTVYGDSKEKASQENSPTAPISAYGLSKLNQESYIQFYSRRYGFSAKIARISNPYGRVLTHGSKHLQGFIDTSIDRVLNKEIIELWGDGEVVRDYIHINDLVSGISVLAQNSVEDGLYNIGSGIGYSLNDVLSIYKAMDVSCEVKYLEFRKIDLPISILDVSKILNKTGWRPEIMLESGISEIMNFKLKII
ncbi:NAD-dependent epimerase/dehydratase family protein [uncultured Cocleimonas sp.]|uniref:NAD-dependent epimerase/dehydratase family protein n=1 Tax=uncultured Cocleimonas sp. TaxID=1051587 RepID=UPI0026069465|nr:NAD-dependent epimerase/dehydratase family protein [uncultured Cocleimonas sp.]